MIDEKTPLLRSMQAVSKAGVRLLKLFGHEATSVLPKIGLEQEFFMASAPHRSRPPVLQCNVVA